MLENKFNLIDEPWIPIVDLGKVSLREVFSNPDCRALGGNPIQKIALTKLLLAIAQAAYTPVDDEDWEGLGVEGLSQKCLAYLDQWHDRFYLYGERPFLQMRAIQQAAVQSLGAVLPQVATGNTTVLTQVQSEKNWIFQDSDKALLVLTLMGFCLGGKKTDNSIVLSPFYTEKNKENGKERSGISGSSLGFYGFMHNFIQGNSLLESLWLNLLTLENIQESRIYPNGLGSPPWQTMPEGEDCFISKSLKSSLMGRLIPLSKFCLFSSEGIHYSDGIVHSGYKEGVFDPSIAVNFSGKTPSAIWVDPEKRPWRQLTALLVSSIQGSSNGYDCIQLRYSLKKARKN